MHRFSSSAPTRVDLAGGTIDLYPIHLLLPKKATVNIAVDLPASVQVETHSTEVIEIQSYDQGIKWVGHYEDCVAQTQLPLIGLLVKAIWQPSYGGIKIHTDARCPAGAGLGGSSALGMAIAGALFKLRQKLNGLAPPSGQDLVTIVQDIEGEIIKAPPGCQDHWGALNGGINLIRYNYGGYKVERRDLQTCPSLSQGLYFVYSGKSRASAKNNWIIYKNAFDGDRKTLSTLKEIGSCAADLLEAVLANDYQQVLKLSETEWKLRKALWPEVETSETIAIDQASIKAGAKFSRVCGAGGGGVLAIFAPDSDPKLLKDAIEAVGGTWLDARPTDTGLVVKETPL